MGNKNKGYKSIDGENAEAGAEGEAVEKASRAIMLTLADGTSVKRTDYCRKRFTEDKVSRSAIAKELSALQGKAVPYQIVFAATKGLEGGPEKVADAVPAAEIGEGEAA